jgi:hypothetical protein
MSDSQPQANVPEAPQLPPMDTAPRASNSVGVAALIVGIVAAVGALIPFLNYLTGFAGVAALILGIVGLTRTGRPKAAALTGTILGGVGLVLSIILAVVYTIGFAAIGAADHAPTALSGAPSAAPSASAPPTAVPRNNPAFGDTVTYKDGLKVSVSAPTPYTPTQYAVGATEASNVVFTVTITNGSASNYDPTFAVSSASSGGSAASQIFDNPIDDQPDAVVPPGQSITFHVGFSIADPNQIVFQQSVNFSDADAVFQS